jgi:hypothetical protein
LSRIRNAFQTTFEKDILKMTIDEQGRSGMRVPTFEFDGCDTARMMNRVFAENVADLLRKYDAGSEYFDRGFLHTSTMPHEGTCYYEYVWSRDAGRGIIETARMGRIQEAKDAVRFLMNNKNMGDHWGRIVAQDKRLRNDVAGNSCAFETDGNALVLLAFYNTWKNDGKCTDFAHEILESSRSVVAWMENLMDACPYGDLIPSKSELSGNPTRNAENVYGIYPNYHAYLAIRAMLEIALFIRDEELAGHYAKIADRLKKSMIDQLVAENIPANPGRKITSVEEGCWINGIRAADGMPFEHAVWGLTSFPVWHWTRQIPFIGNADLGIFSLPDDEFKAIHEKSYRFILKHMNSGYYFRRYGFVSNTGWTRTAGSHDETMCGYGQGFMTQASLMMDDVNTYTKCIDGMMRLAYDGNVTENLSFEMNPWLLHECFDYENYEKGYDHTYGCKGNGVNVYENPGDELTLVQQAEPIKAMLMMAGVCTDHTGKLCLMPRMPWNFDVFNVSDMPYAGKNKTEYLSMKLCHERHRRKMTVLLESTEELEDAVFRAGPFAMTAQPVDTGLTVEVRGGAAWFTKHHLHGNRIAFDVLLQ